MESKLLTEFPNLNGPKVFGKDIGWIIHTRNKVNFDCTLVNHVTDVMVAYVDVLCALFSCQVLGHEEGTLAIAADRYCVNLITSLVDNILNPHAVAAAITKSHVLGILSREGI